MALEDKYLRRMFDLLENDADKKAANAAYGGRLDDGGASLIRDKIFYYKAGVEGTLPADWAELYQQAITEDDPDWVEYERLKKKFGE